MFKQKEILLFLSCFLFFLFWSIFRLGTFVPLQLIIEGNLTHESEGYLSASFDSGSGYNNYEKEKFFIQHHSDDSTGRLISVGFSGKKNPLSPGEEVICQGIYFDGLPVPFNLNNFTQVRYERGVGWRINRDGFFTIPNSAVYSVAIDFRTNYLTGNADVTVNGRESVENLYTTNYITADRTLNYWFTDASGRFKVKMNVPRYAVNRLHVKAQAEGVSITSIYIQGVGEGEGPVLLAGGPDKWDNEVELPFSGYQAKEYFEQRRFVFQLLFSLITVGLLFVLRGRFLKSMEGKSSLIFLLRNNMFPIIVFISSIVLFSLWLCAFWPGVASIDSLNIWRAAKLSDPSLAAGHPSLVVIFYMYLMQFWDNIAVVPLAQIILSSLIISVIYGYVHRRGVARRWLFLSILLLICSVSVGLYNITIWKDIPFALLIVLWGFLFVVLYQKRQEGNLKVSPAEVVLLILLYFSVSLVRHNGLVFIILIPLILFTVIAVPRKKFIVGAVIVGGLGFTAVCFSFFGENNYLIQRVIAYGQQVLNSFTIQKIIALPVNYIETLDIVANRKGSDLWHYYLRDSSAYGFLKEAGWNDVFPFAERRQAVIEPLTDFFYWLYEKSYERPWVYFSWNTLWGVVIFPAAIVLFKWFPRSALFSVLIFLQALALIVVIDSINWRYFYFMNLGSYLLVPIIMLDIKQLCSSR